jgi:hypothetical protein
MCGSKPAPQPAPEQPDPPPPEVDGEKKGVADSQNRARRRALSGFQSTILTGGLGAGNPNTARTSLGR